MLSRVYSAESAPQDVVAARRHTPQARIQIPAGVPIVVLPPKKKSPRVPFLTQVSRQRIRRGAYDPALLAADPEADADFISLNQQSENLDALESLFHRDRVVQPLPAQRLSEMTDRARELSRRELEIVLLKYVQRQTLGDISRALGGSDQTVGNDLVKIQQKLRVCQTSLGIPLEACVERKAKGKAGRPTLAQAAEKARQKAELGAAKSENQSALPFGEDDC
ncbi:sigma-70 RNA polymerase sigma factor region 4 domain-containing protein [Acidithiobacillus sp.]